MKKQCHCLIRHAITKEERERATARLEEAKASNNQTGMLLALAALTQDCPARDEGDK